MSKTATRMYAPFGTRMSLGDWVRVVRAFVGGFSGEDHGHGEGDAEQKDKNRSIVTNLVADLNVSPLGDSLRVLQLSVLTPGYFVCYRRP